MKKLNLLLSSAILGTLIAGVAQAGMLAPGNHDLVPAALAKAVIAKAPGGETEELHYAWRTDAKLLAQPTFEAVSREYWADYSADQLSRGIDLHTTAPGAVVRISPMQGSQRGIAPADLNVTRNGQSFANASALTSVASAEDLAAGIPEFPDGTTAFRLRPELGSGQFRVAAPVSDGRYLIHVYEPDSDQQLKLRAATDAHLSGQPLNLHAQFEDARGIAAVDSLGGVLTAPDGRSFDLQFSRQRDGSYAASLPAPAAASSDGPVLWEVHTFSSRGQINRDAKTAVQISAPIARLDGTARQLALRAHGTNVVVQFGVDSSGPARYQLTGTLWGTNEKGELIPVANAQTAKSLSGGTDEYLELRFMTGVVDPAGVRAPFEIRDLRLQNQADMGLLERRERAWVSD